MRRTLAVIVMLATVSAQAQCNEQRLHDLKARLESERARTHTWSMGWGIGYAALTVAQLVPLSVIDDQPTRVDFSLGALSTLVGVVLALGLPPEIPNTDGLPAEPCAALTEVEKRVAAGAAEQAAGTSWLMHVGLVALNLAFSAVLAFGLKHYTSAVVNFVVSEAAGEATFLTQPSGLVRALDQKADQVSFGVVPTLGLNSAGVSLVGKF